MSLSGHSPVLPWPLGIRAGDTAHHADSEVVPPTVGASTPDSPGNSNVALGAQAGPVVVEAQTEPVRLPSPPPKAQAKKAPPPLRSPVVALPSPPSAEPAQPPPTPPVLAAAAVAPKPSVAHSPWHPALAVIQAEPAQSQSPGGERPGVQEPRSPNLQLFGPKASPMQWLGGPAPPLKAPPLPPPPPRAESPLRPSLTGVSTPGGVELPAFRAKVLLTITDIPAFSHPPFGEVEANEELINIRRVCALRQLHCIDLTEELEWSWRNYICCHQQAKDIIDVGIIRFLGHFMNEVEPDWETLGLPKLFGSHRFYFVACRANGTACRLHPSTSHRVAPGVGLLATWFWLPPLETLPPENRGLYSSLMVYNPGRTLDEPAFAKLECIFMHHTMVARGDPRDVRISVRVRPPDRDSSMFPWHSFLSRWAYGRCLLREVVTSFTLRCDAAAAVIEVTTQEHPAPRLITFPDGWSHLSRG